MGKSRKLSRSRKFVRGGSASRKGKGKAAASAPPPSLFKGAFTLDGGPRTSMQYMAYRKERTKNFLIDKRVQLGFAKIPVTTYEKALEIVIHGCNLIQERIYHSEKYQEKIPKKTDVLTFERGMTTSGYRVKKIEYDKTEIPQKILHMIIGKQYPYRDNLFLVERGSNGTDLIPVTSIASDDHVAHTENGAGMLYQIASAGDMRRKLEKVLLEEMDTSSFLKIIHKNEAKTYGSYLTSETNGGGKDKMIDREEPTVRAAYDVVFVTMATQSLVDILSDAKCIILLDDFVDKREVTEELHNITSQYLSTCLRVMDFTQTLFATMNQVAPSSEQKSVGTFLTQNPSGNRREAIESLADMLGFHDVRHLIALYGAREELITELGQIQEPTPDKVNDRQQSNVDSRILTIFRGSPQFLDTTFVIDGDISRGLKNFDDGLEQIMKSLLEIEKKKIIRIMVQTLPIRIRDKLTKHDNEKMSLFYKESIAAESLLLLHTGYFPITFFQAQLFQMKVFIKDIEELEHIEQYKDEITSRKKIIVDLLNTWLNTDKTFIVDISPDFMEKLLAVKGKRDDHATYSGLKRNYVDNALSAIAFITGTGKGRPRFLSDIKYIVSSTGKSYDSYEEAYWALNSQTPSGAAEEPGSFGQGNWSFQPEYSSSGAAEESAPSSRLEMVHEEPGSFGQDNESLQPENLQIRAAEEPRPSSRLEMVHEEQLLPSSMAAEETSPTVQVQGQPQRLNLLSGVAAGISGRPGSHFTGKSRNVFNMLNPTGLSLASVDYSRGKAVPREPPPEEATGESNQKKLKRSSSWSHSTQATWGGTYKLRKHSKTLRHKQTLAIRRTRNRRVHAKSKTIPKRM